ncbi:sel1 repeat family protein [Clostridium sp. WB02_MRS01]|uniref:MobP3 family relaxase n=1 Tax=Clostridium sp. WB02_MRS01 TaxID=2605777 RepID=UPI0012B1E357|nr:MobP3 family relaxase [Clostridium sp. WB02_MRS01]MSS10909.1 sel1 repeat family protein [Clostridium sp. WB02_MRS01]
MPKIIFTSQYMRDAPPAQLENYVKYIGTREGVEKIDESKLLLPATVKQQQLIGQLIRDIPPAKEMLEYADYCENPTIGNATEFISLALEQNLNLVGKRENYVEYIAGRPRVERIGEHGLFTDAGVPVVLAQVQEDVCKHKGAVWTHVISLRREDAARLGYDSGKQWQDLLRSKKAMLCKHMKIDSENLRWYAAFHNESHHPHVHLMVYSAKDNDGFLTAPAIEAMRSELAHDIFRQDFAHIYEYQNEACSQLKQDAAAVMAELLSQVQDRVCENKAIEADLLLLSKRLQNTGGKKVYGYLKADVKAIIDRIVDELAKEERIDKLYRTWNDWQNEILKTYTNKLPPLPPLSRQKQFKSIKNMVTAEALKLGSHHFSFEDEDAPEPELPESTDGELEEAFMEPTDVVFHVEWSEQYKLARKYLYGSEDVPQDFDKAYQLFLLESESGNALAMHDLGRMFADGLGRDIDLQAAQKWYEKALAAFLSAEEEKPKPYLEYRIGKMYAAGLGTEQDYGQAASWFQEAVDKNHKYAQYPLGSLYYRGQGVSQNYAEAIRLYTLSANQRNPYADYELAKMYRDGVGTPVNVADSDQHFKAAFSGFYRLEKDSHDDKLQYRLGQMLYTGTGTEKDVQAAVSYLWESAQLGNVNAQYLLGKVCLETGIGNAAQAVAWMTKAAEVGNAGAQYALGKLYRDGAHVEKDIQKAVAMFTAAAEQKNEYAAYQLGRLYLAGTDIPKNVPEAVKWLTLSSDLGNAYAGYSLAKLYLTGDSVPKDVGEAIRLFTLSAEKKNEYAAYQLGKLYLLGEDAPKDAGAAIRWLIVSAEQGNQFAQYALGKLYFYDGDIPRDKEKSLYWLGLSAAQGNVYAQYLIDNINSYRNPSVLLAATRLMHRLENLFREDYRRTAGAAADHIDRKRRRKLQEKKQAQGHKRDDHAPQQIHL